MNIVFGVPVTVLATLILYFWYKDFEMDKCQNDEKFQQKLMASWGIIGFVSAYGLFMLALVFVQGYKCIRASNRAEKPTPYNLSSDEEDDREFARNFVVNSAANIQQNYRIDQDEEILRRQFREMIQRISQRGQ